MKIRESGPSSSECVTTEWPLPLPGLGAAMADARSGGWSVDFSLTRRALRLAVGSLLIAGCFSLLLIVGRIPGVADWVSDPLFFRRCLVLHVDLALLVWFFSFATAIYSLLPSTRAGHATFRFGFAAACAGVLAMVGGTMVPGTAPVLANYVPVIDNPIYVAGVTLFFAGVLLCFMNDRLFVQCPSVTAHAPASVWQPHRLTPDVAVALKTTALAYAVAMTTFLVSWVATSRALEAKAYYEVVFWGGGHGLQVANVAAMLAIWLLLLGSLLKRPMLSPHTARILFGLLVAPHLLGPLLTLEGTTGALYRLGFTRLMQFGIAPVVLIIMAVSLCHLVGAWRNRTLGWSDLADARLMGFAVGAVLTLVGFGLGAAIHAPNTMIPAHYHASIGAVTAAFMAVTYVLLEPLGFSLTTLALPRWMSGAWQLFLFGLGQAIFAAGFGLGGLHGMSRKVYGSEQPFLTFWEWLGVGVMGLGGLMAVVGGLLYLALILCAWRPTYFARVFKLKPQPPAWSGA